MIYTHVISKGGMVKLLQKQILKGVRTYESRFCQRVSNNDLKDKSLEEEIRKDPAKAIAKITESPLKTDKWFYRQLFRRQA